MSPSKVLFSVWSLFFLPLSAALLPWGPGYALTINRRSNTEYAYTYPRRLYRTFTMEMWQRGSSTYRLAPFSVAHPENDNAVLIMDQVYVLGVIVMDGPNCPPTTWCHLALSVDLSAYPAYDVRLYVNGRPARNATGTFSTGLRVTALEEERLAVVLGQDQDSVLGGFDPTQMMTGHVDELRIWSTVRTPEDILQSYNTVLTVPFPTALASYYAFDDAPWDATFYEDRVNSSLQRRLYVADYATAPTAPTLPPAYAPPAAPLPALAVSAAPLCSLGGFAAVRVGPAGTAVVPVSALCCNGGSPAGVTVKAVRGGTVGPGTAFSSTQAITFVAASGGLVPGAGFNFTLTDGTASISGFVNVLPNNAPTLAAQMALTGDEDVVVTAWVPVVDPDRDLVTLEVAAAPAAGALQLDGAANRSLRYTPPAHTNGNGVGRFALVARDQWGMPSSTALDVSVNLRPMPNPPVLVMSTNFSIYRGQRLIIPFQAVDVDGNDPFVIVTDWPSSSQGFLEGREGSRTWTINEASLSSKLQWASGFGNYSSMFGTAPFDAYGIGQLTGVPTTSEFGDSAFAWAPLTLDSACHNRADPSEAAYTFYTEFFEATFATPMYLSDVVLVQNSGGDRVSRILVPSDRDPSKWKTVMARDVASLPPAPSASKYSVESPGVCQVLWPVDRVRVEVDTCHRSATWYEVDAVQVRGGVVAPKNVLNTTTQLSFRAAAGYTGTVVFGLTATQCMGSFDDTAAPLSITVVVKDTPYVITTSVYNGWFAIDVGQLDGPAAVGNVQVLELPSHGTLRYAGQVLNDTLRDLGSPATLFEYEAYRCDAATTDTFLVQLGPLAVVQVNVQGCGPLVSWVLAIAVPCTVGPLVLGLAAVLLWRHRRGRRDNSKAPKDPRQELCILFTDIQASTMLWGEVPETMSTALDAHHALIRRLIKKYKCYEVKTIGDSFMITCRDPTAALQLALAIQEGLHGYDWAGDGLDVVYRRLTACPLFHDAYDRLWRGLRVRVGIHYGISQIAFDETTKGYDYYGTVVNAAARIESVAHGGQIVLSREAFEQVADYCDASDVFTKALGSVHLRGLVEPMDLVQVLPMRFAERDFPPLRLEHAWDDLDEDGSVECRSTGAGYSITGSVFNHTVLFPQALDREALGHPMVRAGTISPEAAIPLSYNVFYSLQSVLHMYKDLEERRRRIREMCRQWHVPCQVGTEQQEKASVGRLALQVMGSVAKQTLSRSCYAPSRGSFATEDVYPPRALSAASLPTAELHSVSAHTAGQNRVLPLPPPERPTRSPNVSRRHSRTQNPEG